MLVGPLRPRVLAYRSSGCPAWASSRRGPCASQTAQSPGRTARPALCQWRYRSPSRSASRSRCGRAGELRHRVRELLLLTFAEVRLELAALDQHRVPGCVRSGHLAAAETTRPFSSPTDDDRLPRRHRPDCRLRPWIRESSLARRDLAGQGPGRRGGAGVSGPPVTALDVVQPSTLVERRSGACSLEKAEVELDTTSANCTTGSPGEGGVSPPARSLLLRFVRSTSPPGVVDDFCFDPPRRLLVATSYGSSKQRADSATTARFPPGAEVWCSWLEWRQTSTLGWARFPRRGLASADRQNSPRMKAGASASVLCTRSSDVAEAGQVTAIVARGHLPARVPTGPRRGMRGPRRLRPAWRVRRRSGDDAVSRLFGPISGRAAR